jgi:hypothetical protein
LRSIYQVWPCPLQQLLFVRLSLRVGPASIQTCICFRARYESHRVARL